MYTEKPDKDDDVMTVKDFVESWQYGYLSSDDGYANAMKDGLIDESRDVYPSTIPADATHVVWYNK